MKKLVEKYANIMRENGMPVYKITDVEVVDTTSFFGQCTRNTASKTAKIEISNMALMAGGDNLRSTIVHELCHAMPDTRRHDKQWKLYAKKASKLFNVPITVRAEGEREVEVYREAKKAHAKYEVYCPECGNSWYYTRKCKSVTYAHQYRCSCGHSGLLVR